MARLRAGAQRHAPSAGFAARLSRAVRAARKWRTAARSERPPPPTPNPSLPSKTRPALYEGQVWASWLGAGSDWG